MRVLEGDTLFQDALELLGGTDPKGSYDIPMPMHDVHACMNCRALFPCSAVHQHSQAAVTPTWHPPTHALWSAPSIPTVACSLSQAPHHSQATEGV